MCLLKDYIICCKILFFCSLSSAQSVEWIKHWEHQAIASIKKVVTDQENNCYVAGTFSGNWFNSSFNLTTVGGVDIFVAKLNTEGQIIWIRSFGSTRDDQVTSLKVSTKGNIFITGAYWIQIELDGIELNTMGGNANGGFIAQFRNDGQTNWAIPVNGTGNKQINDIALFEEETFAIIGAFSNTLSIGEQHIQAQAETATFIAKFDSFTRLSWVSTLGTVGVTQGIGLDFISDGTIAGVGNFQGVISKGEEIIETNTEDNDVFLAKWSSEGNIIWLRKAGGVNQDEVQDMEVFEDNIYLVGNIIGVMRLDDEFFIQSVGFNENIFLLRYNKFGYPEFAASYGGIDIEKASSISVNAQGIVIGGFFFERTSIQNFSLRGASFSFNSFVMKLDFAGNVNQLIPFHSNQNIFINSLIINSLGSIIVAGDFQGIATISDIGLENNTVFNPFTVQFASSTVATNNLGNYRNWDFTLVPIGLKCFQVETTFEKYTAHLFTINGIWINSFYAPKQLTLDDYSNGIYILLIKNSSGVIFSRKIVLIE